jgi:cyclophilin family peptidyl-prolyl cis-trans isomerase/HEAT repeat protein
MAVTTLTRRFEVRDRETGLRIRSGLRLLALAGLVVSGCGSPPQTGERAADGLLERPGLQAVVDRQVARDGAGLTARLDDPDPVVRARAAFALASVQDQGALPALRRLLEDRDVGVRADAVFALGQSADSTAAWELWQDYEQERDPAVRRLILEALGKIGGPDDLGRLAGLRVGGEEEAALALAIGRFAIRGIHDPAALERLLDDLDDRDPLVRRNAAYYFGRSARTGAWAPRADLVRARLDGLDRDDEASGFLIQGLGRLAEEGDTERIIDRLHTSSDWRIRVLAARALAGRAGSSAQAALLEALDDEQAVPGGNGSVHVAVAAAEGLAGIGQPDEMLVARVRSWIEAHPDAWQTSAALLPILIRGGESGFVESWLEGHREEPGARTRAVAALGQVPGPAGLERLRALAVSVDVATAAAALDALAGRWRRERRRPAADPAPYARVFIGALGRPDRGIVLSAAGALADSAFRPLGAADALIRCYRRLRSPDDVEAMTAVLAALGRLGDRGALPLLQRVAGDPNPVLQAAARGAVERLTGSAAAPAPAGQPEPTPPVNWTRLAAWGDHPCLVLVTRRGNITVELDPLEAPQTVDTILRLAVEGRYDGVPFHRVVPNFVIQGGDFERGDGLGGPGFAIRSEFTRIPFERGVIGMASAGKDTESSQYFITHSPQPHLDGRYTAFGRVVEGLEAVDTIREGDRVVRALVVTGPGRP